MVERNLREIRVVDAPQGNAFVAAVAHGIPPDGLLPNDEAVIRLALLFFFCFALSKRQVGDAILLRQVMHRFLETQTFEPPVELNRIPSQIVAGLRIRLVKAYPYSNL